MPLTFLGDDESLIVAVQRQTVCIQYQFHRLRLLGGSILPKLHKREFRLFHSFSGVGNLPLCGGSHAADT